MGACRTKLPQLECVHALKGLALPRASQSGENARSGLRRLRSMRVAAPVLFVYDAVTVAKYM